jgi:hypothetical protein
LQRNILNSNCGYINSINYAISDFTGEVGFSGSGTNAHLDLSNNDGNVRVPCITLDQMIESFNIKKINLMKIDVEGYTDVVLSDSFNTLSITDSLIIEFSYGDIELRLKTLDSSTSELQVINHADMIFSKFLKQFNYIYYISRNSGLVRIDDFRDLYYIMNSEASVGDILATKNLVNHSISSAAFSFIQILELKKQNHLRALDISKLSKL